MFFRLLFLDYFLSSQNPHHESLLTTVQKLKSDTDRDVRYFVSFQEETRLAEITDSVITTADYIQLSVLQKY